MVESERSSCCNGHNMDSIHGVANSMSNGVQLMLLQKRGIIEKKRRINYAWVFLTIITVLLWIWIVIRMFIELTK